MMARGKQTVSTHTDALVTVVYPVTDLVRFRDSNDKAWSDFDTLIQLIQQTLAPDSWSWCVA